MLSCAGEHFLLQTEKILGIAEENLFLVFGTDIQGMDQPQFPGRAMPGHIGGEQQLVRRVLFHDLLGDGFSKFASCLPFVNAVEAARHAVSGSFAEMIVPLVIVILWTCALTILAILIFYKRLSSGKI